MYAKKILKKHEKNLKKLEKISKIAARKKKELLKRGRNLLYLVTVRLQFTKLKQDFLEDELYSKVMNQNKVLNSDAKRIPQLKKNNIK